MIEWIVDQLINGTRDINGDYLSYDDAINIIKNKVNEETVESKIKELNDILIFKGYSKIIPKK